MELILTKANTKTFLIDEPVLLEGGDFLPQVTVNYTTHGILNDDHSNVVWIFHALTGNADPLEWWSGLFVKDGAVDLEKHFVICANALGSCYGTTGPSDLLFPRITIKDMVTIHQHLRAHLGIEKIKMGIGGSMGGQQLLEWSVQEPELFENLVLAATNAQHSPWGIAFNEAQRMALSDLDKGRGLETARAIAMLSYRHYKTYELTQKDEDQRWDHFSAASYQQYQGQKLRKRFTTESYYYLSKAMDSHNVGRHFVSIKNALARIYAKTLVIGIDTDILFPINEQELLAMLIPNADFRMIKSDYGHDGFLVETEQLNHFIHSYFHD
ncbi:MAG: homoserine O-acetyltransferase [Flammeovirgaceae bacterium]|jgi:homoserine O-acetyltransferase/O-succinyltransferase|nr:homoserine O-acetyltransferase [Flammeovirgaceae bacterium]|tara:strand:+ start:1601 stop:2578 length:978 start_codon:yes stop_codon:yes gene_type:complete